MKERKSRPKRRGSISSDNNPGIDRQNRERRKEMKKWTLLFLAVVFAIGAFSCAKYDDKPKFVVKNGDWTELVKYPLLAKGRITDEAIKELGLTKKSLDKDTIAFNYIGNKNWRLERIPAGTEVAVDKYNRPWYKVKCGNRLFVTVDKICPPVGPGWRWPWPWNFNLPWWLPLLFLLLLLLLLVPWLIGLLGQTIRGGGSGYQPYIPNQGRVGVVYNPDGTIDIPNHGLEEVRILKANRNGDVFIDVSVRPQEGAAGGPLQSISGRGIIVSYRPEGPSIISQGMSIGSMNIEPNGRVFVEGNVNPYGK